MTRSHSLSRACFVFLALFQNACSKDDIPFECGKAVTYHGENYATVKAGSQCWFTMNLDAGIQYSGSQDQDPGNGGIEKYCYQDNPENCLRYGGLYQWEEMMCGDTSEGAQGVCPDGWHVPSDAEWALLFETLGGRDTAGYKMKSAQGWFESGGGTDTLDLSVLPGGNRDFAGGFMNVLKTGIFWSSTSHSAPYAWSNKFGYQHNDAFRNIYSKTYGFSVRCMR
jgi:uncharacterized protein (TIGR02145 family)